MFDVTVLRVLSESTCEKDKRVFEAIIAFQTACAQEFCLKIALWVVGKFYA